MEKKRLLKMKQLRATRNFSKVVEEDKGEKEKGGHWTRYKYQMFLRAVEEDGILKVAVFTRENLIAKSKEPKYEIYINKDEDKWITYSVYEDKWYTAMLENLNMGYTQGNGQYYSKRTKEIINKYLGTGKMEPKQAIVSFQNDIRGKELNRKHRRELDEIDEVMDTVPEKLPADFWNWVQNKALEDKKYLFYYPGKMKGKCMCCGKRVSLKKKPAHNQNGKCPVCKKKIMYKSWNKQKTIVDWINVGLMQKLTDDSGFVLRKFQIKKEYKKVDGEWKNTFGGAWETVRKTMTNYFSERGYFEYGEYKHTGVDRWCHEVSHGGYYNWGNFRRAVRMYTRHLKRIFKDTDLKYMPVHEMMKDKNTKEVDIIEILHTLIRNKKFEYIIKAGLRNFAFSLCSCSYDIDRYIDWSKKKPWECIKMTKEQFELCRKHKASLTMVRIIQVANEENIRLEEKELVWIEKYLGVSILIRDMKYMTPHRMIKYLQKIGAEKDGMITNDYADYLDQCKELEREMDRQTMFPQHFQAAHGLATQELLEKKNKEEAQKKAMQNIQYKMKMEDKKEVFSYEDEKFKIILPECKEDFIEEGKAMHNCVGGYFERVLEGRCTVLFLRKKEDMESSFCTVEIVGTELMQCRAKCNQSAPQEAMRFMEKFLKELKKRLKKKLKVENRIKVAV